MKYSRLQVCFVILWNNQRNKQYAQYCVDNSKKNNKRLEQLHFLSSIQNYLITIISDDNCTLIVDYIPQDAISKVFAIDPHFFASQTGLTTEFIIIQVHITVGFFCCFQISLIYPPKQLNKDDQPPSFQSLFSTY